MSDIPEWVQQEIQRVRDNNLTELNLARDWNDERQALRFIPDEIFELTQLRILNLQEHNIDEIPEDLQNLKNLTHLMLYGDYTHIPDCIGNLTQLQRLELRGGEGRLPIGNHNTNSWWNVGKFVHLPLKLVQLKQLRHLTLQGLFDTIPEWICELEKLTSLHLMGLFSSLPMCLTKLKHITTLELFGVYLEVPSWMRQHSQLIHLGLGGFFDKVADDFFYEFKYLQSLSLVANLEAIPKSVFSLNELNSIDISHNQITNIPKDILNLKALEIITLDFLRINIPPSEIVYKATGEETLQAIRDYYLSLQSEEEDHLYEAKLLILGEGGAGKTTLAQKLLNPKLEIRVEEKSTEGIDVMRWDFTLDQGKSFRVNVWDFGGQEIYHATHQFFLTNRSLYALVVDNRNEDTNFNYWLNVVELLGGESPVLIIKNEKQDRKRQIGEPQLRERFENIVAILATNLKTNRNLSDIIDEIKHRISHLPHIGTPLPRSWVAVRNALEQDERNYIRIEDYYAICEDCGLTDNSKQSTVIDYLHDLGVCLYFKRDPLLKRYVILKPQWGTSAVYNVLDNKNVMNNFGRFTRKQLDDIWGDSSYDQMHDELLRLMMNFKLCYQIPGLDDTYIAPQLLSENQPEYNWDEENNLFLRYTYDFMPKGIVTRLIVAMHRRIADNLVWKTGAIFTYNETWAEVIEHYSGNEIRIRMMGHDKKSFLAIIMHELDDIHTTYHGLKYDRLIPCNCEKCLQQPQPHFFLYDVLQRSLGKTAEVQCQKSFEMVNTRKLLDDALPDRYEARQAGRTDKSVNIHVTVNENDIERQQIQTNYGGTGSMEQSGDKFENKIEGNNQIGSLNIGKQTFGDHAHIETNFPALQGAPAGSDLAVLRELLERLQGELNNVPAEYAEDVEAVQDYAQAAAEEATKDKPNPRKLKITGESLKAAAENLRDVAPIAVQIAAILLRLGGIG